MLKNNNQKVDQSLYRNSSGAKWRDFAIGILAAIVLTSGSLWATVVKDMPQRREFDALTIEVTALRESMTELTREIGYLRGVLEIILP